MVLRAGDFERVRERVGDVVGVEVLDEGDETVKSFKSVQRCWCWRLWRISMARDSRGDLVVGFERRVDIAELSKVSRVSKVVMSSSGKLPVEVYIPTAVLSVSL